MSIDTTLEAALKRDRTVVIVALAVVVCIAWAYLLAGAGMEHTALEMTRPGSADPRPAEDHAAMAMAPANWTPAYAALMFFMWWIMMVAMMLPSAAPTILVFATINRRQRDVGNPYVGTSAFAAGYVASWAGFSFLAIGFQLGFDKLGVLSSMLVGTSATFGGVLLLAAGLYQLTPIKHACLRHCRSPLAYLSTHWRTGSGGALYMGLVHGAYCVGCCWFLMGLLFFGGVMNLFWIGGLAMFVLIEKTIPAGHWIGYAVGVLLLVWGTGVLFLAA